MHNLLFYPPPPHSIPPFQSDALFQQIFSSHPACAVIRPEMLQYSLCSDQTEGGKKQSINRLLEYCKHTIYQHSQHESCTINKETYYSEHIKADALLKKRTYRFLWFIGRAWIWRHLPNADSVRSYRSKSRYWANPDSEKNTSPKQTSGSHFKCEFPR